MQSWWIEPNRRENFNFETGSRPLYFVRRANVQSNELHKINDRRGEIPIVFSRLVCVSVIRRTRFTIMCFDSLALWWFIVSKHQLDSHHCNWEVSLFIASTRHWFTWLSMEFIMRRVYFFSSSLLLLLKMVWLSMLLPLSHTKVRAYFLVTSPTIESFCLICLW